MSDTEQKSEAAGRPRRRIKRLLGAIVLLGVPALVAALTLWAARPQWVAFVSKPTKTSPAFSLALRVPIGWECREEDDAPDCTVIDLRSKPPIGLMRLWRRYVLRESGTGDSSEQRSFNLIISAQTAGSGSDAEFFRFLADGSLESDLTATSRTFEHPLGPALERTHGQQEAVHDEVTRIVVLQHPKGTRIEIIASRTGPSVDLSRTRSQWDQIVNSLRVVQR